MTLRQAESRRFLRPLPLLGFVLSAGLIGCQASDRRSAEALASRSTATTKALSDYYGEVAADYDRQIVTIPIYNVASPNDEQRRAFAETQAALASRRQLADGLAELADRSGKVLAYSPDDSQAAVRDLVQRIADVSHHPLPAAVALPGGFSVDPQAQLDRAISFLVKAQALREYRKILPPIRDAVAALDGFFEAERPAYLVIAARRLEKDEQLTERVIATDLSIDLTPLQASLDTFGLKLTPSAIGAERVRATGPADVARNELKAGLSVGLTEQLHGFVAARAGRSRVLSQAMLGLTLDLFRATGAALPEPAFRPAEIKDAIRLAKLVTANSALSGPYPKLRSRVLGRLATGMTADELKEEGGLSGRLTARLNDLVFGAPLVGLANELDRVGEAIPDSPKLDPETRSLVAPFYVPVDYANGRGARFRFFSPPAGQAVAEMNRALLVAAFPEFLMEKSRAPRS